MQRPKFAGIEVDGGDPVVLVVGRVGLNDCPRAVAVEGHGAETDRPGLRFLVLHAVTVGPVFRLLRGCRLFLGRVSRGGFRGRFARLPALPSRLPQRCQRIVGDAGQDGYVLRDRRRGAVTEQHQGFGGRLGGADLHPHFFQLDHAAPGHVVRHRVPLSLVPLAGALPQNEVFQRRREVGARDLDVLSEVVGQTRPARVGGLTLPGHFPSPLLALPPQPDDLQQAGLLALQVARLRVLRGEGRFGLLFGPYVEGLPHEPGVPVAYEPGAAPAERDVSRNREEGGVFDRGRAGELGQTTFRAQRADEDVCFLDEGAVFSGAVPTAAGRIRGGPIAGGDEARLPVSQIDPIEIPGFFPLPLAQEVHTAAVTAPVRPFGLSPEPVRVGHDPLEAQLLLGLGGDGEQEPGRQNRAGGRQGGYSRYWSISRAVGASAWSGARLRNFSNWAFALAGSLPA